MFIAWSVLLFATAYIVRWLFIVEFGWADACLFIAMFVARRGPRGQSIVIAVAKWIGTLAPTIALGALAGSAFILGVGVCAASSTSPISAWSFGHARTARYSIKYCGQDVARGQHSSEHNAEIATELRL
jgi:hypothetical protein